MLIFYCNHCNEMLTGGDYESTDRIVDRLDEHIKKCPPAAFTFEGTTGVATQRLDALRSFHEGERRAGECISLTKRLKQIRKLIRGALALSKR